MKYLVSALIPTRSRPDGVTATIDSLLATMKRPQSLQIVLKVDNDQKSIYLPFLHKQNIKVVFSDQQRGYAFDMFRYVSEAANAADGQWALLIDDDAWIEGTHWDEQLADIPPVKTTAQCEFYRLGGSQYGSGSCGPNGLFFPPEIARYLPHLSGPVDAALLAITSEPGWTKYLLKGITYCHDGRPR